MYMRKNGFPGLFIALEGIDRSGKHTQGERIASFLSERNMRILFTGEPWWGEKTEKDKQLERVIANEEVLGPKDIQLLFVDNRARHLEDEILPALGAGTAVACERYFFSTLAYGAVTGAATREELIILHEEMTGFVVPDITFLFDIPAEVAISRLRRGPDVFERETLLSRVREEYISLAKSFPDVTTVIIDGTPNEDVVFAAVVPHLEKALREKNVQAK